MLNVKNWFIKHSKITVFDITLAGVIVALGLITTTIFNIALRGALRVDVEIFFSILLGIIFGPIKGVFLSVLLDHLNLLIKGSIAFWMWQFAITPAIIPLISYGFYVLFTNRKNLKLLAIPSIIISLVITAYFVFFFLGATDGADQTFRVSSFSRLSFSTMVILISVMSFVLLTMVLGSTLLYLKYKKRFFLLAAWLIVLVATVLIIVRWAWGPIAFIDFWNRFLRRNREPRTYNDRYYFYLTPIVFKSLITIPLYSYLLIMTVPIILKLNARYKNRMHSVTSHRRHEKALKLPTFMVKIKEKMHKKEKSMSGEETK